VATSGLNHLVFIPAGLESLLAQSEQNIRQKAFERLGNPRARICYRTSLGKKRIPNKEGVVLLVTLVTAAH